MAKKPVICLMGPTASGKTDIAMKLAEEFPLEIVSVDSALVYRGMNIGSAKPGPDELNRFPHRLIDFREPEETYSAGDFVRDAGREIDFIHADDRIPILVGGTMMYFRSLTDGIANLPAADQEMRTAIDHEAAESGWPAMHAQLAAVDADAAARINPNDSQRIQRALEVFRLSGRTLTDCQSGTTPGKYTFIKLALVPEPRAALHKRIEERLERMLNTGFIDELKTLMKRPDLTAKHASMRAVGYRQFWSFLEGDIGFEDARSRALAATRQLAKRQLTWLRSEKGVYALDPFNTDALAAISIHLRERL